MENLEPPQPRATCRCCNKPPEGMSYEEIGQHNWREDWAVKSDNALEAHLGVREA